MDKRSLRRELFSRIRALTPEERRIRSSRVCEALASDPHFLESRVIFAFLPLPGEPDLKPLARSVPGQVWAFPRVTREDRLVFHRMDRIAEGTPGDFGILEPDPARHPEVSPLSADLILVPGVGFDPSNRARLGRGKGHYDRFLAPCLASPKRPHLIGVAFSVQLETIPSEVHDVPMDRLLTDEGWR